MGVSIPQARKWLSFELDTVFTLLIIPQFPSNYYANWGFSANMQFQQYLATRCRNAFDFAVVKNLMLL